MNKTNSTGCDLSELDGLEKTVSLTNVETFEKFNLKNLTGIVNQGSTPKCVSVCLSDMVKYKINTGLYKSIKFSDDYFFKTRSNKNEEGMSPKEAFNILYKTGISTNPSEESLKCSLYAMVKNTFNNIEDYIKLLKQTIICNGPVLIALPCYDESITFWKSSSSSPNYYHAVQLVGYDKDGFVLKNSWGTEFGNSGYCTLSYLDINYIKEAWVLIR
jgi:C1A family cysteine protease